MKAELEKLREQIDSIDDEIVGLLSKRMDIVKEVGKLKKEHQVEPLDTNRLEALLTSKKSKAKVLGVSQTFIGKVFELIHEHSVAIQKKI
jgi:chorismate mutase